MTTVTEIARGVYRIETPSGRLTLASDELAAVVERGEALLFDEPAGVPVASPSAPCGTAP